MRNADASLEALEDAKLDFMPYRIGLWVAGTYTVFTLGSFLVTLIVQCTFGWATANAATVTMFLIGGIGTILGTIGWFFWLPELFGAYKKYRKAMRKFIVED